MEIRNKRQRETALRVSLRGLAGGRGGWPIRLGSGSQSLIYDNPTWNWYGKQWKRDCVGVSVFCSISGMQRHDIYDTQNEILNQADYD